MKLTLRIAASIPGRGPLALASLLALLASAALSAGLGAGCTLIDFGRHSAGGGADAAGPRDAGPPQDAGRMDAGELDAGELDASVDAGPPPPDAGPPPVLGPGSFYAEVTIADVVTPRGGSAALMAIRDSGQPVRIHLRGMVTGFESIYGTRPPVGSPIEHRDVTIDEIVDAEVTGAPGEAAQVTINEMDYSFSTAATSTREFQLNYTSSHDFDTVSIVLVLNTFPLGTYYNLEVLCPRINRIAPGGGTPNHESFVCEGGGTATITRFEGTTETTHGSGPAIIEYVRP